MAKQTSSISELVLQLVNAAPDDSDSLAALADTVSASPVSGAHLARLSTSLNQPHRFRGILSPLLAGATICNFHKAERHPSWRYGAGHLRLQIIQLLAQRAKKLRDSDPVAARTHARATLTLAAQEDEASVAAALTYLTRDAAMGSLFGLAPEELAKLQNAAREKTAESAAFMERAVAAAGALQQLIDADGDFDRNRTDEFLRNLDSANQATAGRPELEWRIANLAWRFAALARARKQDKALEILAMKVKRWRTDAGEGHFARWLQDAIDSKAEAPTSSGIKVMTAAEVRKRVDMRRPR